MALVDDGTETVKRLAGKPYRAQGAVGKWWRALP